MTLYRPRSTEITRDELARFFANFTEECRAVEFSSSEAGKLEDVKILGRLLHPRMRGFYLYHFYQPITLAVRRFFGASRCPRILEIGCGSGSTSILFALLGARVVGLDVDADMISACQKRKRLYEDHFGSLPLEFVRGDALALDGDRRDGFDGVHALFSFNDMRPTSRLLPSLGRSLNPGGSLVITDGSQQSVVNRTFRPRDVLTPRQLGEALQRCGFDSLETSFRCIVPPRVFALMPATELWVRLERVLGRAGVLPWLASSYTVMARRAPRPAESP
jgi:SAM-dependent methyltransferase